MQLGNNLLSSIKYTLKFDCRNSHLRPTLGWAFLSSYQLAGLGPDSKSLRFIQQSLSTNVVMHFIALTRSVGLQLTLDEFQEDSDVVPFLSDLKPSGKYVMEDIHEQCEEGKYVSNMLFSSYSSAFGYL